MRSVKVDFNVDDTQASIAALLKRLMGDRPNTPLLSEDVLVDLTNCGFLGPSAVTTLSALRRLAALGQRRFEISPPSLTQLNAYCAFAGLLPEFGIGPEPAPHPDSVTTRLRSFEHDMPAAAIQEVVALAKSKMQLSNTGENDLTMALTELSQNVLDHARSPVGGMMSARAYRDKRDIRFAIVDMGIGIRESLSKRFKIQSDVEAIKSAVQDEVTSKSLARNLGLGLGHLHAIVRLARGRMVIYSGNGFLRFEGGRDHLGSTPSRFPGTLAFVRLPVRDIPDEPTTDTVDIWA